MAKRTMGSRIARAVKKAVTSPRKAKPAKRTKTKVSRKRAPKAPEVEQAVPPAPPSNMGPTRAE